MDKLEICTLFVIEPIALIGKDVEGGGDKYYCFNYSSCVYSQGGGWENVDVAHP